MGGGDSLFGIGIELHLNIIEAQIFFNFQFNINMVAAKNLLY